MVTMCLYREWCVPPPWMVCASTMTSASIMNGQLESDKQPATPMDAATLMGMSYLRETGKNDAWES